MSNKNTDHNVVNNNVASATSNNYMIRTVSYRMQLGGLSQIAGDTAGTVVNAVFDILTSIIP